MPATTASAHTSTVETQTQTSRHTTAQAVSAAAGTNPGHKVLAERYKTKLCKNFVDKGMCPYESRCMFAHGDDEMRTAEMNIRDGLVTEDAIRHYKRMQSYKIQAQQAAAEAQAQELADEEAHNGCAPPSYQEASTAPSQNYWEEYASEFDLQHVPSPVSFRGAYSNNRTYVPGFQSHADHDDYHPHNTTSAGSPTHAMGSRKNSSSFCMNFNSEGDVYSYDPYAWTPYHNPANPECDCAECMYDAEGDYSAAPVHAAVHSNSSRRHSEDEEIVPPVKYVSRVPVEATSQEEVAGHALRRPMMP